MKTFASVRRNAGDNGGGAENLGIVSPMREGMSDQPMEDGGMEGSDREERRKKSEGRGYFVGGGNAGDNNTTKAALRRLPRGLHLLMLFWK